jgi:3-oxoacyl-[acyl-carrier-protein] synthase II
MHKSKIIISGLGLVSPFGICRGTGKNGFFSQSHFFTQRKYNNQNEWVSSLSEECEAAISRLRSDKSQYNQFDKSVIMAILAAREARLDSNWNKSDPIGIIVGSSRGATSSFESHYKNYIEHSDLRTQPMTSPVTTLGNLSTAVAQDLMLAGPEISHSITCSSASHSLLTAVAWIRSGMCNKFLVGGSEAPLTDFTISQMKALRVYTENEYQEYPCRPLDNNKNRRNTFTLGEGAAMLAIEGVTKAEAGIVISGIGWGIEQISSLTSVSKHGDSFYQAMSLALNDRDTENDIDLIVAHSPGTILGDESELDAIQRLFGNKIPFVVSPKWQIGHNFGASGAFGIAYGMHLLNGLKIYRPPFMKEIGVVPRDIKTVMINSAGFGGNACSLIIRRI